MRYGGRQSGRTRIALDEARPVAEAALREEAERARERQWSPRRLAFARDLYLGTPRRMAQSGDCPLCGIADVGVAHRVSTMTFGGRGGACPGPLGVRVRALEERQLVILETGSAQVTGFVGPEVDDIT